MNLVWNIVKEEKRFKWTAYKNISRFCKEMAVRVAKTTWIFRQLHREKVDHINTWQNTIYQAKPNIFFENGFTTFF